MKTLQMRWGLCLLVLGLAGSGFSQTTGGATATAATNVAATRVIVVGALHGFHRKNPNYSLEVLRDILLGCKPSAILVELPATKKGKPLVVEGRLIDEYAGLNEFSACQQAAQKLDIPIHAFDMDRLDDIRDDTRYWSRSQRANKEYSAFVAAHSEDAFAELRALEQLDANLETFVVATAEQATPRIINSEAFDSVLRGRKRLGIVFDNAFERILPLYPEKKHLLDELHFIRTEWRQRNDAMANNIERYAKQYRGKCVVVVVGAEHRHVLRDLLGKRPSVMLKEYWEK